MKYIIGAFLAIIASVSFATPANAYAVLPGNPPPSSAPFNPGHPTFHKSHHHRDQCRNIPGHQNRWEVTRGPYVQHAHRYCTFVRVQGIRAGEYGPR